MVSCLVSLWITVLSSTNKPERKRPGWGGDVCLEGWGFLLQLYSSLAVQSEEETGEGLVSVNIRILRHQFTRCVFLTFTVTVITSWGFPTLLRWTGCTFNYSKHWFHRMIDYLWLLQAYKTCHLVTRIHPISYRLFILSLPFSWFVHIVSVYLQD